MYTDTVADVNKRHLLLDMTRKIQGKLGHCVKPFKKVADMGLTKEEFQKSEKIVGVIESSLKSVASHGGEGLFGNMVEL